MVVWHYCRCKCTPTLPRQSCFVKLRRVVSRFLVFCRLVWIEKRLRMVQDKARAQGVREENESPNGREALVGAASSLPTKPKQSTKNGIMATPFARARMQSFRCAKGTQRGRSAYYGLLAGLKGTQRLLRPSGWAKGRRKAVAAAKRKRG